MLIPLGWGHVGGLAGMRESLGPGMFSLATPEGITPWYILMLTINGLVGILAQPHQIAAVGSGRDERACREGFYWGNYVKRVCTVGWALVGLMVAALLVRGTFGTDKLDDPEQAFGFACRHLLFPGSLGLLIACVLAANMSTASAFMVSSGALFTEGLYRRHIAPGLPDRRYLLVGRLSGFVIAMAGVVYALFLVDKVLHAFLLVETMSTFMGVSLLGGIVWRRANRWGALASVVAAFAANFISYAARGERFDHWDPVVFGISLATGIVTLVVVSLLTPPEPAAATADFFARLDTPSSLPGYDGDPFAGRDRAAVARAAAATGQQSIIVNLLAPGRAMHGAGLGAYREDLRGFFIGWLWVLALLAAFWAIFRSAG
jgi:Na+/proline symporter